MWGAGLHAVANCAQAMTVVLQQAADLPLCHAFLRHKALPGGDVSGSAASCAF